MSRDPDQRPAAEEGQTFLQRWSRRKHASARDAAATQLPASLAVEAQVAAGPAEGPPREAERDQVLPATAAANPPLPPIESLTFESDFRAFLQPHVTEDIRRQALRKLLHDPRFNAMDGLDVYIDDYSVPSPLEPELARTLAQARYIFDPPPTRVNAAGHVEDVPPEELEALAEDRIEERTNPITSSAVESTPPHDRQEVLEGSVLPPMWAYPDSSPAQ